MRLGSSDTPTTSASLTDCVRSSVRKNQRLRELPCVTKARCSCISQHYVPVIDEVQDTLNVNSKESHTETIKLPNKMEFKASVWYTSTPEEFLNHVKGSFHACERMGLFSDYTEALKGRLASKQGYDTAASAIKTAQAVTERTKVQEAQLKELKDKDQRIVGTEEKGCRRRLLFSHCEEACIA